MRGRLVVAIVSTTLEEAVILAVYVWGLPMLDIKWPLWPLPLVMLGWIGFAVFSFQKGTKALERKVVVGLPSVIGCKGKVNKLLAPDGLVSIGGELWTAYAVEGEIAEGEEVVVVEQDRTKVVVSRLSDRDKSALVE
jgi:membrane-bound ClpP family serine protease